MITVEDSGYGFLERIPGTGIGLVLVRERINFNDQSRRPDLWKITNVFGKKKARNSRCLLVDLVKPVSFIFDPQTYKQFGTFMLSIYRSAN